MLQESFDVEHSSATTLRLIRACNNVIYDPLSTSQQRRQAWEFMYRLYPFPAVKTALRRLEQDSELVTRLAEFFFNK